MLGSENQEGTKREEGHGDFLWVKAEILVWQLQGAPEKMLLRRDLSKDFLLSDGVQEGGVTCPAPHCPGWRLKYWDWVTRSVKPITLMLSHLRLNYHC